MIARRQQPDEDRAARVSGPVLVCDTDALATCVWQERYMGRSTGAVERRRRRGSYALEVLTSDDIPFVQDGLRDGEHVRAWMTQRFRERLQPPVDRGPRQRRGARRAGAQAPCQDVAPT